MKKCKRMTYYLFSIVLLFAACGTKAVISPALEGPAPSPVTKIEAEESWQGKWEKTLSAAQKEGKVVIYAATPAPALKEAIPSFKKKFGFGFEVITGRGAELRGKLFQERTNGLFITDVFIAGLGTVFGVVKPSGAPDPIEPELILPEVVDPKAWFDGKLPWADKERLVIIFLLYPSAMIGINTEVVNPEAIKSYFDLLNPVLKGKIIINDPTVPGTGSSGFANLLYYKMVDMDFFHQLVKQEPLILRDQRLQVDWLARGKYPVGLWPSTEYVSDYQKAGTPLALIIPKEGTYLSVNGSGLTLMNQRPHPNATRVFINWLFSKEGQLLIQNYMQVQSAREDLPTDKVERVHIREPGKKYYIGVMRINDPEIFLFSSFIVLVATSMTDC